MILSVLLQHHVSKLSRYPVVLPEVSKFQQHKGYAPNKCVNVFEMNISVWLIMLLIILITVKKMICRRQVGASELQKI
jgi:hypothetical protein